MRNRNYVNQGNRLQMQNLSGYYQAPIKELDLENDFPNYKNMTLQELNNLIDSDFINNFTDSNGKKLEYWDEHKVHFYFRDGKSDVYTKGGLDFAVFQYLDNQIGEVQKWRIETNATHVDFKAGGKITIGTKEYRIMKVLTIITSGTRPNKFFAVRNYDNFEQYATKMLALA